MVPLAVPADLHDVAPGALVSGCELQAHLDRPDSAVVLLEAVTVDVSEQNQLLLLADRAVARGGFADVPCRAHQLGMSVAQVGDGEQSASSVAQQRALGERVVDDAELSPLREGEGGTRRAHGRCSVRPPPDEWVPVVGPPPKGPGRCGDRTPFGETKLR